MIAGQVAIEGQLLDLVELEAEQLPALSQLAHPVTAYLNGLAPSSRRPQLAALESIARRSTQIYTAETMPWQRLRRAHVLKIRSLLEENYRPASANRMLAALRGVLCECWHAGLRSTCSRLVCLARRAAFSAAKRLHAPHGRAARGSLSSQWSARGRLTRRARRPHPIVSRVSIPWSAWTLIAIRGPPAAGRKHYWVDRPTTNRTLIRRRTGY